MIKKVAYYSLWGADGVSRRSAVCSFPFTYDSNGNVTHQTGFSGDITGYMDVLFLNSPAGKRYNTETYYWGIK